eukprot:CAMPEP_0184856826 /NCGR_PEP_ID=MMETSP0580-20130426/2013_1 /TAXON_ID=1118495 /ORGANISM="Dactyliosolen fragilissimus" /LENGTH=71 /DNA_ID=CAMNT_0027352079 /DNA_START=827 /DNA_END=1042 /DNA_ORIENTATION=-
MYPPVKHYRNKDQIILLPGMIFTIEPTFVEGSPTFVTWNDGHTISTIDGGLSAQFEHMVLITDIGAEILTK